MQRRAFAELDMGMLDEPGGDQRIQQLRASLFCRWQQQCTASGDLNCSAAWSIRADRVGLAERGGGNVRCVQDDESTRRLAGAAVDQQHQRGRRDEVVLGTRGNVAGGVLPIDGRRELELPEHS